jgi:hypothetical protein
VQYRDLTGAFSVPSWVGDTGSSLRGVGLGLYDQGRGIVSLAAPAGWRAVADGTADAYHEGGIGLAVNQFNPAHHFLANVDNGWQLAQQGCITQATRALTNATINAATTAAIATSAARTLPTRHPTPATETVSGAEKLIGESRTYVDLTRGGSIRNIGTDATHSEFAGTLTSSGWISRTSKDSAVQILQKDGAKYVLRSKNSSGYPGWTADFTPAGSKQHILEIRLGYTP